MLTYVTQLAPPKAKYIETILGGTRLGEAGVADLVGALQKRTRDPTWTVAFKAFIVVHLMIREGQPNVTLDYLAGMGRKSLGVANYTDGVCERRAETYGDCAEMRLQFRHKVETSDIMAITSRSEHDALPGRDKIRF